MAAKKKPSVDCIKHLRTLSRRDLCNVIDDKSFVCNPSFPSPLGAWLINGATSEKIPFEKVMLAHARFVTELLHGGPISAIYLFKAS